MRNNSPALQNHSHKQALYWGLIHGLNDLAAGYMLARYALNHNSEDAVSMLIIYAVIGFGGQLPLAFWLDRTKIIKPFAIVSVCLLFLSLFWFSFDPFSAIILTGMAGAGIHVTGATICLQVNEGKASLLGIFTAPGVLGLTIGGLIAGYNTWPLVFVTASLLIFAIQAFRNGIPNYQAYVKMQASALDTHDWIMLMILIFMCFRSFVFDLVNLAGQQYPEAALILGLSAFGGKILGGFIADRFGWKRTVYAGLFLAFIFLQFGKENIYALAFGVACLQSSVPVTLVMMSRSLPLYPAMASALSLGTTIAVAGLPLFLVQKNPAVLLNQASAMGIGFCIIITIISLYYLSRKNYWIAKLSGIFR